MRRISYRPYAHLSSRNRFTLHPSFGWTLLFGLLFITSATLVPKEMIVTSDPSFKEIAQILKAKTGLPWRWMPPSGGTTGAYRITVRQNTGKKPPGLVLGRVPLLPVVYRWNPVETISRAELVRIKNGDIKRWDQLGGDTHPITAVSGKAAARSLQLDPSCFGWLYWPQLNFRMKVLKIQGSRFPWEGGPDPQTNFGWAVLELPHPRGRWPHFSRTMRESFVKRTIRKHFDGWGWLYGRRRAVVTVVGDMLFDRGITETAWDKFGDYSYVFGLTAHTLRSSDLVIGNLESPFNLKGWPINMFTGDPRALPALRYGGFDVVSLANNHTLDCGTRGLLDTVGLLRENGIKVVGAGANREEARRPQIYRIRGIR
ncbi:MAG TPA: CapA family protein, partial [Bacillota bacterium]|nr:CapA family protein [Bacillota bacterium]